MSTKTTWLVPLAILLGVAANGRAQTVERRTLAGDDVAVYNLVGILRVEGGSGSDVVAEVTRRGRDGDKLRIEAGDVRGHNTLRVIYPDRRILYRDDRLGWGSRIRLNVNDDGTFDSEHGGWMSRGDVEIVSRGDGLDASADVKVMVPKGKRIAVHLAAGEATVENVEGDIFVDVHAAPVTTNHTRGTLSLDTGSGAVRVNDANGDVDLDSGSGEVEITGIQGTRLRLDSGSGRVRGSGVSVRDLDLDTGSGSLRLMGVKAEEVTLDSGSGSVELGLLSDVNSLRVDSGSGGVTLRVPEALGAEFSIETGSGDIDFDFPVQIRRRERNYLAGSIGDGKGRIRIETGSGGVRFLKS